MLKAKKIAKQERQKNQVGEKEEKNAKQVYNVSTFQNE